MERTECLHRISVSGAQPLMLTYILFIFAVFTLATPTSAATPNSQDKLDNYITKEVQIKFGFDSLTVGQRDNIATLIDAAYQQGLKAGTLKGSTESVIETQIDGEFEGWDGETIVKLINGQIWQQTEYHYNYTYSYMPDVLIYRSASGYKMSVEGADKPIMVTRLK